MSDGQPRLALGSRAALVLHLVRAAHKCVSWQQAAGGTDSATIHAGCMHTTRLGGDGCAVLSLGVHQHLIFVACRRARAFDGAAGWQVALWSLTVLGSWPIVHLSTWEHRRMPLEAHHCPLLRAWRVGVGVGWPRPLRPLRPASSACVCVRRGVMVVVVRVCGRRVRAVRWRRAVSQCFLLPACCGQSRGR